MCDKPARPFFSCGPTVKPLGWEGERLLQHAVLNRNHRADVVQAFLSDVILRTRRLIGLPDDHVLMFIPGSCTGAFEAACWNLLGPRPVDCLVFDPFGREWARDVIDEMGIAGARRIVAADGTCPNLEAVQANHDVVTVWNATPTGVILPDKTFAARRTGLVLADITSAVMMTDLPWHTIDAAAFSGQKALGGEAQLGFLTLSARALDRLAQGPFRALPKLMRLTPFDPRWAEGRMINTPSLLALADWTLALDWAEGSGGTPALRQRVARNYTAIADFVAQSAHLRFAVDAPVRSTVSVTLHAPGFDGDRDRYARVAQRLEAEGVAYDILGHRLAPAAFRVWCGPTVETGDIAAMLPWLETAIEENV